jgi:DNA-binding transcriptional regulator GbsR (MarR family)
MQTVTSSYPPAGEHRLGAIEAGFVQNWGALSRAFGMDPILGRVHALAFLSTEPVSARHVARALGLDSDESKSCLEQLEAFGAVREIECTDGELLFEADGDPWSWFLLTLKERGRREFGPLLRAIREANSHAQQLRRSSPAVSKGELHRMERIARFTEFVEQIAGVVETFAALGAGPLLSAMRMMARVRAPRLVRV